jgi:hypothetical protein
MPKEIEPGFADGGCLCGAVRYRVSGPPRSSSVCHCRSCRLATGAPAVAWVVFEQRQFEWLQGRPATRHSSPQVTRGFCARCGTPLCYRNDDEPGIVELTTATLDHPELFAPTREIWLEHRLAWQPVNTELPRHRHGSGEPPI